MSYNLLFNAGFKDYIRGVDFITDTHPAWQAGWHAAHTNPLVA